MSTSYGLRLANAMEPFEYLLDSLRDSDGDISTGNVRDDVNVALHNLGLTVDELQAFVAAARNILANLP